MTIKVIIENTEHNPSHEEQPVIAVQLVSVDTFGNKVLGVTDTVESKSSKAFYVHGHQELIVTEISPKLEGRKY